MGEIQRYCFVTNPPPHIPHVQETNKGEWVRFTDHERVVAEKDARIKELEGRVETGYRAGINATTGRVLGAVKEVLDRHGAPPFAQSPDLESAYAALYRLVLAALSAIDPAGEKCPDCGHEDSHWSWCGDIHPAGKKGTPE